ncbi:hypothetical protein [Leyella stercorea]|uniref:hypothetical protein n=1 Tax=Leyella stercorea TaxID=363265 RepID=UPI003F8055B7
MEFTELYKINNLEDLIKELFIRATNKNIEEARKDSPYCWCYTTPIPETYWGGEFRNLNDLFIEQMCKASIVLAHYLAQPIKEKLPFYDLICCAYPYINNKIQKQLYKDIIRYTKDEKMFDYYSECIVELNKEESVCGIQIDAIPYIKGYENLPKSDSGKLNIYGCDVVNALLKDQTLILTFKHSEYSTTPICSFKIKFNDVCGNIPFPICGKNGWATLRELTFKKSKYCNKILFEVYDFHDSKIVIEASTIEISDCKVIYESMQDYYKNEYGFE